MHTQKVSVPVAATIAAVLALSDAAWARGVDVIVEFNGAVGPAERALISRAGGEIHRAFACVPAVAASLPAGAIGPLLRDPSVAAIVPDGEVRAVHIEDSDLSAEVTSAWGVDRLDADKIWIGKTAGAGVGVAIVDTGSGPHVDLPQAVVRWSAFADVGNDDNGHGTHVAGTALARLDGAGVAGVAPEASLYSYKVLDSSGSGSWSNVIAANDAIASLNAAAPGSIFVANYSLGSSQDPGSTVKSSFDALYASGVLLVAAAGNYGNSSGKGDNVSFPARWDSTVAVAATDSLDHRVSFSSTGPTVELAAPGALILSTRLDNTYLEASGTSMAAPHVTGAAALVRAWGGVVDLDGDGVAGTHKDVRLHLQRTARDRGRKGKDNQFGYGLVDPYMAIFGSRH